MDKEKQLLTDIASALQKGAAALTGYQELAERFKKTKDELTRAEESITVMKNVNRGKDKLINKYREVSGMHFIVCPSCAGEGGYNYEGGPGEYGYEPCNNCGESGIISQQN
jgi:hypothetical protein